MIPLSSTTASSFFYQFFHFIRKIIARVIFPMLPLSNFLWSRTYMPHFTSYLQKLTQNRPKDLIKSAETIEALQENTGVNLGGLGFRSGFLNTTPTAQANKEKKELDLNPAYVQLKSMSSAHQKTRSRTWKGNSQNARKHLQALSLIRA